MIITQLGIKNYRNLDGITVYFPNDACFIIGENNLGKSNLLRAINNIFLARKLDQEDFYDSSKAIEFVITIYLEKEEFGLFDDFTNPFNPNYINISIRQDDCDSMPTYTHLQSGQSIPLSCIREMLVIDYDSIRNPKNEISFQKSKGAASLLNYLIRNYVINNKEEFINKNKANKVEKYINSNIEKIIPPSQYGIKATIYSDNIELLSGILNFKDTNGIDVSNIGYGVQYNILILFSIFEKIINYIKRKKRSITNISALLTLDEPEIHLHPHMQRSLVKKLQNICDGKDNEFNSILKSQFNIDKFRAQLIVSTHSPNIINEDYKTLCRFYKDKNGKTNVVSSINLLLDSQEEKQLYIQYLYVKEAMFARGALIFEGDSEYWCFPGFASKLGIDFDYLGITLIKANGAESIVPLIKLLEKLEIRSVGIIDKDKKSDKNALPNIFFTTQLCFDSEIVATLIRRRNIAILNTIIKDNDTNGLDVIIQKGALSKIIKKYNLRVSINDNIRISSLTKPSLKGEYFLTYVTWFSLRKGACLSKYISENIEKKDIPCCYVKAIKRIVVLVK